MTARGSMTDRRSIRARSLVAALLAVFLSGVAAKSSAPTCVSHAGYPDFLSHGKPPSKNRGLTFCQQYERSTCCDRGTTDGVRRVVAHMQANGFSPKCREAWTSLECSVCDPRAGVTSKTPVCAGVCDAVFRACADEHFAEDALGRVVPCRASDTICAKLSDWMAQETEGTTKGTRMCVAAGYDVVSDVSSDGRWCFDGAEELEAGASGGASSSSRASSGASEKAERAKKKKKKKGGMVHSEAEEFAKLQSWMSRVYVVVGVGAVARVAYKVWDRRRTESSSGAARRAARVAAENRSRRAAFDNQAKML